MFPKYRIVSNGLTFRIQQRYLLFFYDTCFGLDMGPKWEFDNREEARARIATLLAEDGAKRIWNRWKTL
jgi:hypothetical protein